MLHKSWWSDVLNKAYLHQLADMSRPARYDKMRRLDPSIVVVVNGMVMLVGIASVCAEIFVVLFLLCNSVLRVKALS